LKINAICGFAVHDVTVFGHSVSSVYGVEFPNVKTIFDIAVIRTRYLAFIDNSASLI